MKQLFISLKYHIIAIILKLTPLFSFPKLNNILFRMQGYNIHKNARLFSSVQIIGALQVSIGNGTFIGHRTCIMGGKSKIIIGDNCDISSMVNIISGTHDIDMFNERTAGEGTGQDIVIENGVWIGFGSIILSGVKIGYKSIIGAGSLVCKDIPSNTIAVGNPCKPIKYWNEENKKWIPLNNV